MNANRQRVDRIADSLRVEREQVAELHEYFDQPQLMSQLGLLAQA